MNYKNYILNLLLDKYERSEHFKSSSKRNVFMYFNQSEFPEYDIEKAIIKDYIHYAAKELENEDLISIHWVKYEVNNIIKKVALRLENIKKAYQLAYRKPKVDILEEYIELLMDAKETHQSFWIVEFLDVCINEINANKRLQKLLPKDVETLCLLLATFRGIEDKGDDEILARIFSKRYLGDSKAFEQRIKSKLNSILKEFYLKCEVEEDGDLTQIVGIINTTEDVQFFGPLVIDLFGQPIDFMPFYYGSSLNSDSINKLEIVKLNVNKVITIENKATYIEFVKQRPENTLVIYLAGFYSPKRRLFLQKISDYLRGKQVEYYHWGDIDLGGIRIFTLLKTQIFHDLKPLYMDKETLIKYEGFTAPINENTVKKLLQLLENEQYSMFAEVIGYMIKMKLKLEQEAVC